MLSIDEALALVVRHSRPKPPENVAVLDALGLVLAEAVTSDVDSPPHDKTIVDGYAVIAADLADGAAELTIIEEVTAGQVPTRKLARGQATRVMTGAPLPAGADAVVMLERTSATQGATARANLGQVRIGERARAGQNIVRRGASIQRGATVLNVGDEIRPIEIGILAEVGRTAVCAIGRPTVAVLPTGNELVPAGELPAAGQIRNTNGPMLLACARRAGATPIDLGIGRDDEQQLRDAITRGLAADILVISGGVSAGVLDLVPGVLAQLGVEQVFHKVNLKPGKPLWFGVLRGGPIDKLVFGLPGNPVSSLVCFELFVRPAIGRLAGRSAEGLCRATARLASEYVHRGDRPTYHPARLRRDGDEATVEPLPWVGSGDLATLARADALAHFPAGDRTHAKGDPIEVLLLGAAGGVP